ncbi:MAG TPA: vitamin K epoxide reductase family protein [Longimicrobiales bacterium]|nr:vitamin K epoxide reductase family protein [Longimicrobiales bacterium]
MALAVLALLGVLVSLYMSLYKLGLIPEIACGGGSCSRVQNSPWAMFLGVPVPFLGLAGYGALLAAALFGLQPDRQDDRRISIVLLAGAVLGFGFSLYLTYLEAVVINAWCRWCVASAIIATLILLAAIPEIRKIGRSG